MGSASQTLTKTDIATVVSKCASFQQQTPILSLQHGDQPLDVMLITFHPGRASWFLFLFFLIGIDDTYSTCGFAFPSLRASASTTI